MTAEVAVWRTSCQVSDSEQDYKAEQHETVQTIDPQQSAWYAKYKSQANIPLPTEMLLNSDPEPALADGFTSMFNGKDLTGWSPQGGTCTFQMKDGLLEGQTVKGSESTYLCTDKNDYKDFVFTCDMKWLVDGNSGVMFRAQTTPGRNGSVTVFGPQAEMEGTTRNRGWSGGIYGQSCGGYFYRLWLQQRKRATGRLLTVGLTWREFRLNSPGDPHEVACFRSG
jgi:hypothetical protein